MAEPTVEQVIGQVRSLPVRLPRDEPVLGPFDPPVLQGPSEDYGFGDFDILGVDHSMYQDARIVSMLERAAAQGETFAHKLYAARSISKAIPQVKSNDQPNRMDLYAKTVETLQPVVDDMKAFMQFYKDTLELICQSVQNIAGSDKKDFREPATVPDAVFMGIAKGMNALFTLDNLKNIKSAWNNDFSAYKRACSNLKKLQSDDMMQFQELYMLLATNNFMINNFKSRIEAMPRAKDVIAHIANVCADHFEDQKYLLPSEKHMYLKVLTFCIYVLDGHDATAKSDKDDSLSIHKVKRVKLDKIRKIFKQHAPVIPLAGDIHIEPANFFRATHHLDVSTWTPESEDEVAHLHKRYALSGQIAAAKNEYHSFMCQYKLARMDVERGEEPESFHALVLQGIRLVSSWTSAIIEQAAWKYAHPIDKFRFRDLPEEAISYERAVRYNYSQRDREELLTMIAMIKDVRSSLLQSASTAAASLKTHVHLETQRLVHGLLQPLIQQSNKKKRKDAAKILAAVFNIVGDMDVSVDAATTAAMAKAAAEKHGKGKKKHRTAQLPEGAITLPERAAGISAGQMFLLRTMLSMLLHLDGDVSGKAATGLMKEKDFTPEQLQQLHQFYSQSTWFQHLINFEKTVLECSDLSSLWYKEFYLELAKEIQFPIEMSLPWILASTAINTPHLHAYVAHALELYNDSATHALHKLKSQTLFDEISSEVNLGFDQLVFEISQNIFTYYRARAVSARLEKAAKDSLESKGLRGLNVPAARYNALLQQRRLRILGRDIDFHRLLSQGVRAIFSKTLDAAISVFEAEDISFIIAFEDMLQSAQLTHRLLSEFLALDPFEHILAERNHSMNPASNYGRIEHKIIFELLYDFMPNFCYSSELLEFKRTPLPFAEQIERESPPKISSTLLYGSKYLAEAMEQVYRGTKDRFRIEHVMSLIRLVGPQKLGALIYESCQNVGLQMMTVLKPFIDALVEGMPPKAIKEPDFFYGIVGSFQYYQAHLKPILQYPDLSTEVYQVLRTIGNTFALIALVEHSLDILDTLDYVLVDPFAHIKAPVRRVVLPTIAELRQSGRPLGFDIMGGLAHNRPIVISKVEPGSYAELLGLRANDEILDCNGIAFRFPEGAGGPRYIAHEKAADAIKACAGYPMLVQSTEQIPYTQAAGNDIQFLTNNVEQSFKARCAKAGALSNSLSIQGSVFKGALTTIDDILDKTGLRKKWFGKMSTDDVIPPGPDAFFRLWSAIQFSYTVPSNQPLNTKTLFGEGLQWGGLAIVYLLGQQHFFESTDYTYYLLKMAEVDTKVEMVGNIDMADFLRMAKEYKQLNERIFGTLQIHYPEAVDRTSSRGICHPPSAPGETSYFLPSARETTASGAQEAQQPQQSSPGIKQVRAGGATGGAMDNSEFGFDDTETDV